jgi:hypothetical protein
MTTRSVATPAPRDWAPMPGTLTLGELVSQPTQIFPPPNAIEVQRVVVAGAGRVQRQHQPRDRPGHERRDCIADGERVAIGGRHRRS